LGSASAQPRALARRTDNDRSPTNSRRVPLPASKSLKPAAEGRAESAAGQRKGTGHRRRIRPVLCGPIYRYRGGRGKNGGGETLDAGASALLPSASSPRRPDSGPGRKRQDSGAAMAGGLSWPRRSDGLTFCGWLRLSWAGGGFFIVVAEGSILQSDEPHLRPAFGGLEDWRIVRQPSIHPSIHPFIQSSHPHPSADRAANAPP